MQFRLLIPPPFIDLTEHSVNELSIFVLVVAVLELES